MVTINLSLNKLSVKFTNFHHNLLKTYYQYYGISKNFLTALWQKFIKFPLKSYLGTSLIKNLKEACLFEISDAPRGQQRNYDESVIKLWL